MSGHLARAGRRPRLVDLVHYDALHFGHRAALRIDGNALTYRELEQRVTETARALGAHIKGGDRVAIWLPNSFSWVASFLAREQERHRAQLEPLAGPSTCPS